MAGRWGILGRRARAGRCAGATRTRPGVTLVAVAAIALAGCSTQVRHHGYAPDDAALSAITVGQDTREQVAAAVGRPGAAGLLRDSGWYYVGSRWEHFAYRAPVEVDREVVAISFDDRGVVSNIERFGLAEGQVVPLSRRVTDTGIRDMTLLAQLMRNLGRFTTATFAD